MKLPSWVRRCRDSRGGTLGSGLVAGSPGRTGLAAVVVILPCLVGIMYVRPEAVMEAPFLSCVGLSSARSFP